jgi:hypothetical protein
MSDLSQDSWSVPVANHGMVVLSYIVIFVEFIYVLILIFAYHTLSSNSKDGAKWKLSYSNPRPMWMMQIAASVLFETCNFLVSGASLVLFVHPLRQMIQSAQMHNFPSLYNYR